MSDQVLRVHAFLEASYANGPGRRAVLWLQGCTLACPGCFNPLTHTNKGGEIISTEDLFNRIVGIPNIEGLTVSGGEPLQQLYPLLSLLERLRRETALSTILFTGYDQEEILRMPLAKRLTACIDVLIAGRYEASRRLAQGLLGSANKRIYFFTDRYHQQDFLSVPPAEIILSPDGKMILSGIDPLDFAV